MNKHFLTGNIGKDPEIIKTDSGKTIAKFSIAEQESFKNQNQEWETKTHWHTCVAFGYNAEKIEKSYSKGNVVMICGATRDNIWQDKEGNKRKSSQTIIETIERVKKSERTPSRENSPAIENEDDDLPF